MSAHTPLSRTELLATGGGLAEGDIDLKLGLRRRQGWAVDPAAG